MAQGHRNVLKTVRNWLTARTQVC